MNDMEQVKWSIGGIFKADANKCYSEIKDIEDLTPASVLEIAEDETTELHKCFTWDNDEASHKWRLQEAQKIIRTLVVIPQEEEAQPTRVFQISSEKSVYKPIAFFQRNKDEYQKLLERAKNELMAIRRRYENLAELEEVFGAIDAL